MRAVYLLLLVLATLSGVTEAAVSVGTIPEAGMASEAAVIQPDLSPVRRQGTAPAVLNYSWHAAKHLQGPGRERTPLSGACLPELPAVSAASRLLTDQACISFAGNPVPFASYLRCLLYPKHSFW